MAMFGGRLKQQQQQGLIQAFNSMKSPPRTRACQAVTTTIQHLILPSSPLRKEQTTC